MGILADIFVSTAEDALEYDARMGTGAPRRSERYELAEHKGVTDLEFSTLRAILETQEWDLDRHSLKQLWFSEDSHRWLMEFPEEFVSVLATTPEGAVRDVSSSWGATEELNCPGSELVPLVKDLIRLARLAQASKKGMYLWGSL